LTGWEVEVQGEAAALVALGLNANRAQGETLDPADVSSAKVVAGAGYNEERTGRELRLYV
jgi:hypothetical protein